MHELALISFLIGALLWWNAVTEFFNWIERRNRRISISRDDHETNI